MFQALKNMLDTSRFYSVPTKEEVERLTAANMWTPDMMFLEQHQKVYLFVPDNCRAGQKDHEKLGEMPEFKAVAFTKEKFSFWRRDLGKHSFPVAIRLDNFNSALPVPGAPAPIRGDLYLVDVSVIKQLDIERRNGLEFKRERITVDVPYRSNIHPEWREYVTSRGHLGRVKTYPDICGLYHEDIRCWMYVGVAPFWEEDIFPYPNWTYNPKYFSSQNFKPVSMFEKNSTGERYYEYIKREYEE